MYPFVLEMYWEYKTEVNEYVCFVLSALYHLFLQS